MKPRYQDEAHFFTRVDNITGVMKWLMDEDEPIDVRRERMLKHTAASPDVYESLFGKRHQTFSDSEGRRLSVWRIEHEHDGEMISFWLFAHKDRGSSMEIYRGVTPAAALATVQWLQQKIPHV